MKLFLDFLPLILFFATFKYGEGHKDWAAAFANQHVSTLTSGGVVAADQAPMLLATLVTIAATLAVVALQKLRGRRVDLMLWLTLVIVVVLGGLTIWFHDDTFIKWKPTGIYWTLAAVYWASEALFGRNILQTTLGEELPLPAAVWHRLNGAWIAFFAALGLLNIAVAYSVDTATWVNFKVFGTTLLSMLFIVGQGLYIHRVAPDLGAPAGDREPSA